jgi:cell division protein FtsW (lipid II flippase)
MSGFIREIPIIETLLIISALGLCGLGFLFLHRTDNPTNAMKHELVGKVILAGLVGVAIMAIILLVMTSIFLT